MTEPTPILTAADLDRMANDYYSNLTRGGTGPECRLAADGDVELMTDAEMGAGFREIVSSGDLSDQGMGLAELMANSSTSDLILGRRIRMLAAAGEFEQQLNAYQREHQVSGLVEDLYEFTPLGFSTTQLRVGLWLELIAGDAELQQQSALRLGRDFLALAEGAGSGWLRYSEVAFKVEDDITAWRYVRDGWSSLDAALQGAATAWFGAGVSELTESTDLALTIWTEDGEGDCKSFLLVHPSLAPQLDDPDAWWC
jgi:hypothetical protein